MAASNIIRNWKKHVFSLYRTYQISSLSGWFRSEAFSQLTSDDFDKAKERLSGLKQDPGNQSKLKLYALFKQATVGKCNVKKPGMMDFVGKAKWEAWNALGDISQDEAKDRYVQFVNNLCASESSTGHVNKSPSSSAIAEDADILDSVEDKIHIIMLNRPAKKNAIKFEMYPVISDALEKAAKDDSVLAVITGAGDYYCSGNDLSNFQVDPTKFEEEAKRGRDVLMKFVASFIDFPKPLIAVVNGPAVGISVTLLSLCDVVYATDKATFHTPFSLLGQSPEACSSFTFPMIMGHAKASEMLLFNRKLTANEAKERGLVTEVFPDNCFKHEVWTRLRQFATLPKESLRLSKLLVRECHRENLHSVNKRECELLMQRWISDECINAIMNYFQQKSSDR